MKISDYAQKRYIILNKIVKYSKIPSLTLYKAKNSHNPSVYLWCGCFDFCIDIVLFWKLCYFFCFVSLMIVRISAFEMNS